VGLFKIIRTSRGRVVTQVDETAASRPAPSPLPAKGPVMDPAIEAELLALQNEGEDEDAAPVSQARAPLAAAPIKEDVPDLTSGAFAELVTEMQGKNADWTKRRVMRLTSPAEVARVREIERSHPRFQGGRSMVLNALEERLGELSTPDPNIGLARAPRVAFEPLDLGVTDEHEDL